VSSGATTPNLPSVRAANETARAADRNADATLAALYPTLAFNATEHITNAPGFGHSPYYQLVGTVTWRFDGSVVPQTSAGERAADAAHVQAERARREAEDTLFNDYQGVLRRQADADARTFESMQAKKQAALSGSRSEDVVQARARVLAAAARRDQAQAQLDRLTVRAPIAGQILQLKFRAGEYYTPGGDALVVMGDTRILRVRMDVDERDVARVALGDKAFATLPAFPGRRFPGTVVEVGKHMGRKNVRTDDPTERIDTKILEVVFQLDDAHELVPGLRVVGYIEPKQ
jgi:multidrug resistance efflux pump